MTDDELDQLEAGLVRLKGGVCASSDLEVAAAEQGMSDEANKTRQRGAKMFQTPEVSAAQYWEAQAEMWHENYKGLMAIEEEHRRFKAALKKIAGANYNGPRAKLIAEDALTGDREP